VDIDAPPTALRTVISRYNFHIPVSEGELLYNADTGAVLHLRGNDAAEFARTLSSSAVEIAEDAMGPQLVASLLEGGFLVPSGTDEIVSIRDRFAKARGYTPLVLTLTTTMECNLGCFYCYEQRSPERLELSDIPALVQTTREKLRTHPTKSLHVDWYGGEPLLNIGFIETASPALQAMCRSEGAAYHASVISNGTAWPDDAAGFVERHQIRQVQLSFDGLAENHNRRRRFRSGYQTSDETSFELIIALVDRLLDCVRVDLRFNMDRHNQADLLPFVEFARSRGWFSRRFPAVMQPARLASYSERSAFMREREMPLEQYDNLRRSLAAVGTGDVRIEEAEVPDGFPYPKTYVCAALATQSFVVGADGLQYRCGLQVGEKARAVGSMKQPTGEHYEDRQWWEQFDPTTLPSCSRCSFLPICWGGCPKKHLERDEHALNEQSVYWRTNLPRLVASRFGFAAEAGFSYTEADQFR
jgi:uncharacterized protein